MATASRAIQPRTIVKKNTIVKKTTVVKKNAIVKKKTGLGLWMDRVLEECDRASLGLLPDPVHDLRVALRRCRSVADGVMAIDPNPAWKNMKRAGRDLFRSLGALRDVHVMQEWTQRLSAPDDPATAALLIYLQDREIQCKTEAFAAISKFDRKQWAKWAASLPRRAARLRRGSIVFEHLALEHWTNAHELHRRALRNRSRVAFHNLRIGLKRFRYIVENFLPQHAPWARDLKELQDLLGEVHDLDVLWATALQRNVFTSAEIKAQWQARIVKERGERIDKYRNKMLGKNSLWQLWRVDLPAKELLRKAAISRLKLWAAALDPDFRHSAHVTKLALQLYDAMPVRPIGAALQNDPRGILQIAALLHGVGRSKREKKSHKATYKLIDGLVAPLGFAAEEFHMAAVISRYHQGALPQPAHEAMHGLTSSQRKVVRWLAGILRLADSFDAERDGRIQNLRVQEKEGYLVVSAPGYSPQDRIAEGVAAARHLLETVCARPLIVNG